MAHDHAHMDHGGMMDHMEHNTPSSLTTSESPMSGHDHSGHNMETGAMMGHGQQGGDHMMAMFFHTGVTETILFSFWKIDSVGGLIGSMIGIFLMAMLYEGLKVLREYLLQRTLTHEPMHHRVDSRNALRVPLANNGNGSETPEGSSIDNIKTFLRPHPFSISHTVQTFLHMLQVFISYLLMLIFMTYNVWLALAVILGAGAGYFVFGWRKKTVIDINEHCH